jgi:4-diphosphocytidyl-2-C-methyl-D-erythritol kinase
VAGNLVVRALGELRRHAFRVPPDDRPPAAVDVRLRKRTPVAAGLGGGSSDAAAALRLLGGGAFRAALDADPGIPARLGADVPFFVARQRAALVSGIGESMAPLPTVRRPMGVLLVAPGLRLATSDVFAAWDGLGGPHGEDATDALAAALRDGLDGAGLAAMAPRLRDANDLWPAAASVAPSLQGLRDALESATGRPFLLTGSGSTLLAIYPSVEEAAHAGRALASTRPSALDGCRLIAVDDVGPEPSWRFP